MVCKGAPDVLNWDGIEPAVRRLLDEADPPPDAERFLLEWTDLADRVEEARTRLEFAANRDTGSQERAERLHGFMHDVYHRWLRTEAQLRAHLLATHDVAQLTQGVGDRITSQAAVSPEHSLFQELDEFILQRAAIRIAGAQTVEWGGKTLPLRALAPILAGDKRSARLKGWRLAAERRMEDAQAMAAIWADLIYLRRQRARIARLESYVDLAGHRSLRPPYPPATYSQFHYAVEEWVSPVLVRLHEERRQRLGGRTLRPWDMSIDLTGVPSSGSRDPLPTALDILRRLDTGWGDAIDAAAQGGLVDLSPRTAMLPAAYVAPLPVTRLPAVLLQTAGDESDLDELFRILGHALSLTEASHVRYAQVRYAGRIVPEAAGMAIQLIAGEMAWQDIGAQGAACCVRMLERFLMGWATAAMTDVFQRWAYDNPDAAADRAECERQWHNLWLRFMPGVDWTGLEKALEGDWQRHLDLFLHPCASSDSLLGSMAAVEIWSSFREDRHSTIDRLKRALALGGTKPVDEVLAVARAQLQPDEGAVRDAVEAITEVMDQCERALEGAR